MTRPIFIRKPQQSWNLLLVLKEPDPSAQSEQHYFPLCLYVTRTGFLSTSPLYRKVRACNHNGAIGWSPILVVPYKQLSTFHRSRCFVTKFPMPSTPRALSAIFRQPKGNPEQEIEGQRERESHSGGRAGPREQDRRSARTLTFLVTAGSR